MNYSVDYLVELLIPNFLEFLRQHGEINIVEEFEGFEDVIEGYERILSPTNSGLRRDGQEHVGLGHLILLNSKPWGYLETYDDPGALIYHGRIPEFNLPHNSEFLRLIYQEDHPNAKGVGRIDVWDIPFP